MKSYHPVRKNVLLEKLLIQNRPRLQVVGAAVGAFIGLTMLLFSLQTRFDLHQILRGADNGDNFIILNKPVSLANTLLGKSVFRPEELQDIEKQSFTKALAQFTPNLFKVSASSRVLNFYTELFLESIPPQYLDFRDPDFRWQTGQTEVPIILSKDYLALYNFGFAVSQGLPQFTPQTIRQVRFDINLRGKGREETFQGRIIGFSSRINSILVPENFMAWANTAFGDQADLGASRILLQVQNPYDKTLSKFISAKGYELSSGRLIGGRLAALLQASLSVLGFIGLLLMVLATLVFVLNYQVIVSKSAQDIQLFLQIGYKPSDLFKILRGSLLRLLGTIFGLSVGILAVLRYWTVAWFAQQDFDLSPSYHPIVWLTGLSLMALIVFINLRNVGVQIRNFSKQA
jgi:hypothetical protein